MNDTLTIKVNASTESIVAAEKELGIFQHSINAVNVSIKQTQNRWSNWANVTTAASTAFKALHTAIHDFIIAPLAGAVNGFMALGDQISKTSQRIGMSTETLGGLKFAAEQCGANFEILTEGIKAFQNQLGAAQMGDTSAISKLGKVGLNADDFVGLSNEDQLMKLADHIKAIGDKSEQTRVAMELFGKAGFKLLPFFQEGSAGIKKLIKEGKDIGAVLGEDAVNGAVEMTDAMNRMKTSSANVSNILLSTLAPAIIGVLDAITELSKWISKFVAEHHILVTSIGVGIAAFSMLHFGILGIIQAMPGIIAAFTALKAAFMTNPLLLTGAAIIGVLVAAFMAWNQCMAETEKRLYAISDAAEKQVAEVEKAQAADQKLFDRLKELESIEDPLSNNEIAEAGHLIRALTERYGDLGLEIDKDTGKIKGLAEAQKKMVEKQNRQEVAALEAEIKEHEANAKRLENKMVEKTSWFARFTGRGYYTESAMQEDADKIASEREKILLARQKIWAITGGPDDEENEEDEDQETVLTPQEQAQETAQNKEERKQREELQKSIEANQSKYAEFVDKNNLASMNPWQRKRHEIDTEYNTQLKNLNEALETAETLVATADDPKQAYAKREELIKQVASLNAWKKEQYDKLDQEEKAKQKEEQKALNPELKAHFDTEEIEEKKQAVEDAKQKEADAILAGDLEAARKAREEADAANIELAKAVATASGAKRTEAAQKVADAKAEYDQAKKEGANNKTLNELYEKYEKALAQKEQADREYYEAVGTVQAGLKTPEEKVQDAVQTTLSTSGTFSAYGMDAAVQVNVTQEILVTLQKIYGVTDKMEKNQGNESVYTEKK